MVKIVHCLDMQLTHFKKKSALLRFNSHTIQFTPLKYMMVFSIVTDSCIHHHCQLWNIFIIPQSNSTPLGRHSKSPVLPAQATTNLLSVRIDLSVLDIFCKCNHAICGPL